MKNIEQLVSIIMPAYNSEKFITDAINSVKLQSYKNWELIVINDGSSDKTEEVVMNLKDPNFKIILVNLKINKGIANARNVGIEKSHGKYVAFLDSDDMWKPEKLSIQIGIMEKKNYKFTYSSYDVISDSNLFLKIRGIEHDKIDYKKLLKSNWIGCLTVVINRELIIGNLMPEIRHEDYATWLTILKKNNCYAYGINQSLALYRSTNNSMSSNKCKSILWVWNIFRKNQNFNFIEASMRFLIYCANTMKKSI